MKIDFKTNRLLLRNLKFEDLDIIYDYRNNEICSKYQRSQEKTKEGIKKLIEKHKNDKLSLEDDFIIAVELNETKEIIGEIVVMYSDETISLGYTFSYKHHRKGYAYESLSFLIKILHEKYPNFEFISFTECANNKSINLLKKLGYQYYGYSEFKNSEVFGKYVKRNPFE